MKTEVLKIILCILMSLPVLVAGMAIYIHTIKEERKSEKARNTK